MADRSALPALGPDAPFVFPSIRRARLDNGLPVWTVQHGDVPVVTMVLLVRAGSSADPGGRPGLASLTGDMLDEGAGDRSAYEVHEALARIGAQFDTEVGPDATFLTLTTLEKFRADGLALLADLVARPRFDPAEFSRVRQLRASRLRQMRDVPSATADRAFATALYGAHPYGHLAIGTLAALDEVTLDEVVGFHRQRFRPEQAVLIVAGSVEHATLIEEGNRAFAAWPASGGPGGVPGVPGDPPPPPARLLLVERAQAAQSELRIGHVAVSRRTPDYHALLLANLVLGGQFVSRLNMNLREDKGFTYGARSWFEFRLGRGPFQMSASVQTEVTGAAITEAIGEVAAISGDRPVTREELENARAALTRGYARNFETADQVARSLAQLALYELPDDYFATFVPAIERLELDQVRAAAARHLHPDRLVTLVVGDAVRVAPALAGLGLGEPVHLDPP